MTPRTSDRYPWAPVGERVAGMTKRSVADLFRLTPRNLYGWIDEGVPDVRSVHVATVLGVTPVDLWPDWSPPPLQRRDPYKHRPSELRRKRRTRAVGRVRPPAPPRRRYPVGPLEAFVAQPGSAGTAELLARRAGVAVRTVHKWRHLGLSESRADELACRLDLHPALVWPEWLTEPVG